MPQFTASTALQNLVKISWHVNHFLGNDFYMPQTGTGRGKSSRSNVLRCLDLNSGGHVKLKSLA